VRPDTKYQWCLYVAASPWLALVSGPIKPVVAVIAWLVWLAAMLALPPHAAIVGAAAPVAVLILSMTAGVLLLCDLEIRRYEALEHAAAERRP